MALEQVGTLLWELRTAAGWSQGQLAQRAGVSKSALSQWEAGLRQPRVPELEATLTALGATSTQRALAFSLIEAPRALRQLRDAASANEIGPQPTVGEFLRAMRLRGRWTQEQIARRLGVGQNTVARWERSERLPSAEQMQALCFALEAHESERVALTTDRFAETESEIPTDPEHVRAYLAPLLYDPRAELVDLHFLIVERALWRQMLQDEQARPLLAEAYAKHAHYLSLYERWEEVKTLAERVLALTHRDSTASDHTLRAALKLAEALVYGGDRLAPERGLHLLKTWLPRSTEADYTAWILSDMGEYMALAGQKEHAVNLGQKAVGIAEYELEMRLLDQGQLLLIAGYPDQALEHLPSLPENAEGLVVYEALIRCEACLNLGIREEALQWLQRANAIIETFGMKYNRPRADQLALRF